MMLKTIYTNDAPAAIGPYSPGMILGDLLFTSGQIPLDPESGEIVGSEIKEQTRQVIKNLQAILESGGSSLQKVIKTTCFLKNMSDFVPFNTIYAEYFTGKPARSCVEVARLPKDVLVEIEVIAVRN